MGAGEIEVNCSFWGPALETQNEDQNQSQTNEGGGIAMIICFFLTGRNANQHSEEMGNCRVVLYLYFQSGVYA